MASKIICESAMPGLVVVGGKEGKERRERGVGGGWVCVTA